MQKALAAWTAAVSAAAGAAGGQVLPFTIDASTSALTGNGDFRIDLAGTLIGNYDQASNPTGTRTLNFNFFGIRPGPPTNIAKNFTAPTRATGPANGRPTGAFVLEASGDDGVVILRDLATDLLGAAADPTLNVTATFTYEPFLTANPNNAYPFLVPIPIPLGSVAINDVGLAQVDAVTTTLTPDGTGGFTFSALLPAVVTAAVTLNGAAQPATPFPIVIPINGTLRITGGTATAELSSTLELVQESTEAIPLPPNTPLALPPLTGTGDPANLLINGNATRIRIAIAGSIALRAGAVVPPECISDFDGSGGVPDGTDVSAFFDAWLAGDERSDVDGSGGVPDGSDVEFFFGRWLAGC